MAYTVRLKEVRRAAGLTQQKLAKLASLTQSTISKYERDALSPSLDDMDRIATKLGKTYEHIWVPILPQKKRTNSPKKS